MAKMQRHRAPLPATPDSAFDEGVAWARVLSLTSALLTHMAGSPETQRFVAEMLAAGVMPNADALPDVQEAQDGEPFHETLTGLQMRELDGPDVFHEFFGARNGNGTALPR